jgi:ABC-type Mn2+/Zn2+ transport system ATPase subunit
MNNFYIDRVQVEGGFLDGLDVRLKTGLNTIIGARGTGKSTLVELIRFCLGIKGQTSDSNAKSLSHARAVLRDGQVTITLSNEEVSYSFSRSVDCDTTPAIPSKLKLPLIFSQTEVETIGLLPSGRLNIIDNFISSFVKIRDEELSAITLIESYSSELIKLIFKISDNEDKTLVLPHLMTKLSDLKSEEAKVVAVSEQAAEKSRTLNHFTNEYVSRSKVIDAAKETLKANQDLAASIRSSINSKNYELPVAIREIPKFLKAQTMRTDAITAINTQLDKIQDVDNLYVEEIAQLEKEQAELTRQGQVLRKEVDQYKEGAGELSRTMQNLKKEISQIESIKAFNLETKNRVHQIREKRDRALDDLENARGKITQLRQDICDSLNKVLQPKIRVKLEQLSQVEEYEEVLVNAMKGSGIRYNELAPIISQAIPPRILLNIVERDSVDEFTSLVSVSKDRASKVLNALKSSVDLIATVRLEDEINFGLLDGSDYKGFHKLSTGQRCTVILPIILEHQDTVLIVDQPEDHIDNAFIVETLISSIQRRAESAQIIVTTHNANIPVLGQASEVVHLNSDGTRGYVVNEGELNSPHIIEAISNVMEGGKDAFKRRAEFYG